MISVNDKILKEEFNIENIQFKYGKMKFLEIKDMQILFHLKLLSKIGMRKKSIQNQLDLIHLDILNQ